MLSKLRYKRRESLTGFGFALPAIVGMLVFFLIPFAISLYTSLTGGMGSGRFLGLENYGKMLQNESFQIALGNTLRFIGIGVPLIMAFSLFIALLLHRKLNVPAVCLTLKWNKSMSCVVSDTAASRK